MQYSMNIFQNKYNLDLYTHVLHVYNIFYNIFYKIYFKTLINIIIINLIMIHMHIIACVLIPYSIKVGILKQIKITTKIILFFFSFFNHQSSPITSHTIHTLSP